MLTDEEFLRLENLKKNHFDIVSVCRKEECEFCREVSKIAHEKGIKLVYEDDVEARIYLVGIPKGKGYVEKIKNYIASIKSLDNRFHMYVIGIKPESDKDIIKKFGGPFEAFLGISQEEDDVRKTDEEKDAMMDILTGIYPGIKIVNKFETKLGK